MSDQVYMVLFEDLAAAIGLDEEMPLRMLKKNVIQQQIRTIGETAL